MSTLKFSQSGEIGERQPKAFKIYLNGKSKVKTGCVTCKIRRIKCDESKPACNRCTSTGRKCDGYSVVAPNRSKMSRGGPKSPTKAMSKFLAVISQNKVSYQPGEFPDCTLQERRSLDFFVSWSAHCMKPWPGEEFWKVHVPSLAYSEPSIRHAMIAIANTHEEMREIREGLPSLGPAPPIKFARRKMAIEHYHKSVSELSKVIAQRGTGSEVVALLNSALFFCFDFMWGNVAMALLHYQSGAEIFEKWREKHGHGKEFGQGSVETNLATLFNMEGTMDSKDGNAWESEEKFRPLPNTLSAQERATPRTAFVSLDVARRSIHHLMWEVQALIFIDVMRRRDLNNAELSYLVKQEEASCRTNLKLWSQNFEAYPESLESSLTIEEEEEMDTIRLMYLSALIWLWAGVSDEENPLELFSEHLKTADQVYKHLSRHGSDHFTKVCLSDSRIWPAYAIIATRCDDPELTRRAREMVVKSSLGPRGQSARGKLEEHSEENRNVQACSRQAKGGYLGYEYYLSKRSQGAGAASANGTMVGAMAG